MTMNPLPPQAYTKETLVQAYAWLQSQSESVKEIATTPDVLVSLYLKAKLQGQDFLERPSIQNFKNELKNLAGMIGEFEVLEPSSLNPTENKPAAAAQNGRATHSGASAASSVMQQQIDGSQSFRFRSQDMKVQRDALASAQALQTPSMNSGSLSENMEHDSRTLAMIQEVKQQFNLTSEDEALRMLVATGFHQLKTLIK